VINVDGITGGFNFQNAWSTAWICANAIIWIISFKEFNNYKQNNCC
jgi:hypothetical protein